MAAACTGCNWNAQLLEVLQWSSLMATIEDDRTELENYPMSYGQFTQPIEWCCVGRCE